MTQSNQSDSNPKRVKWLTHKSDQYRLATIFAIWMVGFWGIFALTFFCSYVLSTAGMRGDVGPGRLEAKFLLYEQLSSTGIWIICSTLLYLTIAWSFLVYYLHRFTGPIFKLTKVLQEAVKNHTMPERIHFRKRDAFQDLAEIFNEFLKQNRPNK